MSDPADADLIILLVNGMMHRRLISGVSFEDSPGLVALRRYLDGGA